MREWEALLQVDMLGSRYKSVNFEARKSPDSPKWRLQIVGDRAKPLSTVRGAELAGKEGPGPTPRFEERVLGGGIYIYIYIYIDI